MPHPVQTAEVGEQIRFEIDADRYFLVSLEKTGTLLVKACSNVQRGVKLDIEQGITMAAMNARYAKGGTGNSLSPDVNKPKIR